MKKFKDARYLDAKEPLTSGNPSISQNKEFPALNKKKVILPKLSTSAFVPILMVKEADRIDSMDYTYPLD
jgi:hypothetical protein